MKQWRAFTRFIKEQGYPRKLLWTTADDAVFWRGRYYVRFSDPSARELIAKATFDEGLVKNMGIELAATCGTHDWTVCRIYVPTDDEDARYRMIPQTGVKTIAVVEPQLATMVKSRVWWVLKWLTRKDTRVWN